MAKATDGTAAKAEAQAHAAAGQAAAVDVKAEPAKSAPAVSGEAAEELQRRVESWPVLGWKPDDPFRAEKEAMLACIDGSRPTRPRGTHSLLKRLIASGTGRQCLEPFFALLPRDRYGQLTGDDVPVQKCLDAMEEMIEKHEAHLGDPIEGSGVPLLDRYTYEKACQIAKVGYWQPPSVPKLKLDRPLADEPFNPDEESADDDTRGTDKKKANRLSF